MRSVTSTPLQTDSSHFHPTPTPGPPYVFYQECLHFLSRRACICTLAELFLLYTSLISPFIQPAILNLVRISPIDRPGYVFPRRRRPARVFE
uniref:Uncharacterized protein n=1 Tax=Anguilla anguilla TaxID=7936 RepID=A0A0E9PQT1_ANGAN